MCVSCLFLKSLRVFICSWKKSRKNESVTKKTSDLLLPVRTLRQSKAHGIYIVPFYSVEQSKAVSTASHDSPSHMHTCLNTF